MEAPGTAGPRARQRAEPPRARRADEPPGYRSDDVARAVPRRLSGRGAVRHARSRVSRTSRYAHRRARPRHIDLLAWRLSDLRSKKRRGARERGGTGGEVRKEAGEKGRRGAAGREG